ncbi:hypothetical protein ACGFNP_34845 [Nonomuraea sp. NPDC049269]|uniref:hypothetical protein n=1 Tax=Nonomuraea sp. NPDC049269 TaxID=3364349 RepID=UPI00371B2851
MLRSHKLLAALALTTVLSAPAVLAAVPAANASATASSCRVEFYDLDAINVSESDGKDELRLKVDGYLWPAGWVNMREGDDADPAHFSNVSTTVSGNTIKSFSLREVTPPAVGSGTSLGSISAYGGTCQTLDRGEVYLYEEDLTGTLETPYWYVMKLRMIGE